MSQFTTTINVAQLQCERDLQTREKLDDATIKEYAEAMDRGDVFPPIVVFEKTEKGEKTPATFTIADGQHRFEAAKLIGIESMDCDIKEGAADDALLFALKSNCAHGLRRTNRDKRRAAWLAWVRSPEMSERTIASLVGVTHPFVAKVKREYLYGLNTPEIGSEWRNNDNKAIVKIVMIRPTIDGATVTTLAENEPEKTLVLFDFLSSFKPLIPDGKEGDPMPKDTDETPATDAPIEPCDAPNVPEVSDENEAPEEPEEPEETEKAEEETPASDTTSTVVGVAILGGDPECPNAIAIGEDIDFPTGSILFDPANLGDDIKALLVDGKCTVDVSVKFERW